MAPGTSGFPDVMDVMDDLDVAADVATAARRVIDATGWAVR
jgi:hypothetical protein